jgi:hypothetical protein
MGGRHGGRKKIYSDPAHEKLRQRVAKFRQLHAAKLAAEMDQKRIMRSRSKVAKNFTGHLLWEIVDDEGRIIRVVIRRFDADPPDNGQRSKFLPSAPVEYSLARVFRQARLTQLGLPQWGDGPSPFARVRGRRR